MHSRLRPSPAMIVAVIALFVALGGSAAALSGSNTVFSDDIANDTFNSPTQGQGGLVAADLRPSSVGTSEAADNSLTGADVSSLTGADVSNDSLTGADINEGTLGQVPSALLGGKGGWQGGGACNPGSMTFIDCGFVTLNLPASARVLLAGIARAVGEGENGQGTCRLVTSLGHTFSDMTVVALWPGSDSFSMVAVTPQLGPGNVDFGVECRQEAFPIRFFNVGITAVAISPN